MKKHLKLFSVFLVLVICSVCLAGCVRFHATFNVKKNGKLDVSMLFAAADMSEFGYDGSSISENALEEYMDAGWDVEEYDEDGFSGYIISKNDIPAEELKSNLSATQSDLGDSGDMTFTKKGRNYVLDWQVFDENYNDQISSYKSYFKMSGGYMKLTFKLPNKPVESNATSVSDDGKTLEWDLLNLSPDQKVHVEFSLTGTNWLLPVCVVGGLLLAAILVVVFVLVLRDRKARMGMNTTGSFPLSGGYQPQNMAGNYSQNSGYQPQNMAGNYPQNSGYQPQNMAGNYPQNNGYQPQNMEGNYPQNGGYQSQNTAGNYPQSAEHQIPNMNGGYPQPGGFPPQNMNGDHPQMPADDLRFQPKAPTDADNE